MIFGKTKIEQKIKEYEKLKQDIINERKLLEKINNILEDKSEKIDITDLYVLFFRGLYYIVKKEEKERFDYDPLRDMNVSCFEYKLIDVFSNNIIYRKKFFSNEASLNNISISLTPILEVNPNLLIYADRKVPIYILQNLLYKLNEITIDDKILLKSAN